MMGEGHRELQGVTDGLLLSWDVVTGVLMFFIHYTRYDTSQLKSSLANILGHLSLCRF